MAQRTGRDGGEQGAGAGAREGHRARRGGASYALAVLAVAVALAALPIACGSRQGTQGFVGAPATTDPVCAPKGACERCDAAGHTVTDADCVAVWAGVGDSPCALEGQLPEASSIALEPAWPKLAIAQPIDLRTVPDGTGRVVVATRPGRLLAFVDSPAVAAADTVLDLTSQISTNGEGGLLAVAFAPDFASSRKLYVNYTSKGAFRTIVSEFSWPAGSDAADVKSERVVLDIAQPWANHNGGHLVFDASGMLLVAMGDGGSGGDPLNSGQDMGSLLGKILRIDPRKPSAGKAYGVPADNPFVGVAGARPEIWALGLRNPWRLAVDASDGTVFAADVGQGKWEEVNVVEKGGNYGWKVREGDHCFAPASGCASAGLIAPVAEYGHDLGLSITGGEVYRGNKQPALHGAYLYADYATGRYWTLRRDGKGFKSKQVLQDKSRPVSFGTGPDGEVYVLQLFGAATILRVVAVDERVRGATVPAKLSATGCLWTPGKPVPAGMIPYQVAHPLWSDGVDKHRFVVPPKGTTLSPAAPWLTLPTATANWQGRDEAPPRFDVPVGTLLVKHFAQRHGAKHRPIETRMLRRDADGWTLLTYVFDASGDDADLALGGAKLALPAASGLPAQAWQVPSGSDCASCHPGDNKVAGFHPFQLRDPPVLPPDGAAAATALPGQLHAFAAAGLVGGAASGPATVALPWAPAPVAGAGGDGDARARAWLHVQCGSCHQPGGTTPTALDLRYHRVLDGGNACLAKAQQGDLGVAGAALLTPGAPEKSVLLARMKLAPGVVGFMPAAGVLSADADGVEAIGAWIAGLPGCR